MTRSITTTSSVASRAGASNSIPFTSRGRTDISLESNSTFYFSSAKVEDLPKKTNQDVSGVGEAKNDTKPAGEQTILTFQL